MISAQVFADSKRPSVVWTEFYTLASGSIVNSIDLGSHPISTASAKRIVVVGHVYNAAANPNAQIQINSTTANLAVSLASGGWAAKIWTLPVATGTTCNLKITVPGTFTMQNALGVWAMYDLRSETPTGTASSSADPAPLDLFAKNKGVIIGISTSGVNAATFGWTGATADYTDTTLSITRTPTSGVHALASATGTFPLSLDYSITSANARAVAASWR